MLWPSDVPQRRQLVELLSRGKRVFVAIGVANIVGPTGIAARLQQAGYTVTRVQ